MAGLTKAKLVNFDTKEEFVCLFNPTEYSSAMTANWESKPAKGRAIPFLEYTGGDGATINAELFFDAEVLGSSGKDGRGGPHNDVRETVNKLTAFMNPLAKTKNADTLKARPPYLLLQWGQDFKWKGVMTNLAVRYTLFNEDGLPTRCTATITLKQVADDNDHPGTNPTSFSEPGHKRREVQPHDTLALIAHQEYGTPNRWRVIADANGLEDPLDLHPGQILAIPPA